MSGTSNYVDTGIPTAETTCPPAPRPARRGPRRGRAGPSACDGDGSGLLEVDHAGRPAPISVAIVGETSAGIAVSTVSATSAWPPCAVARDLHAGDVDAGLAEEPADGADDAGPVRVARRTRGARRAAARGRSRRSRRLLDLLRAGQGAGDRDRRCRRRGCRAGSMTLRKSALSRSVSSRDLDAALLGEQRRVDVGDLLLDDVREQALERGELAAR